MAISRTSEAPLKLSKTEFKLFLDIFNLFDQNVSTAFDYDREASHGSPNPDFGLAINTVPPRSVRVGAKFSF